MAHPEVSPRSLVLDLLRAAAPTTIPIRVLVLAGAPFGLSDNAVRVATTRLLAAGKVESDERGRYRLASDTDALTHHVERWRSGEAQRRPWSGQWLAVWMPKGTLRAERRRSLRALSLLGFREGLAGLWVRPDNLARSRDELESDLQGLGLDAHAELFAASSLSASLAQSFATRLYDLRALDASYDRTLRGLSASLNRVRDKPLERALVETFVKGGRAIRVLATDPWLPTELLPADRRRELWETMITYDAVGRELWARALAATPMEGAPAHLSAMARAS
ncbi:MAG: hypothetical protein KF718_03950 [Polyangiaceae bacterium]|nr:hypothetical protein [Polyangiaceae bacterium]